MSKYLYHALPYGDGEWTVDATYYRPWWSTTYSPLGAYGRCQHINHRRNDTSSFPVNFGSINNGGFTSNQRLLPARLGCASCSSSSSGVSHPYNILRTTDHPINWSEMFSQIAPINDHLFLSGFQAISIERIRQYGITQIVTAMIDPLPKKLINAVSAHVQVTVEDSEVSNLRIYFDSIADRIASEAKRGGKTLVHCMAGISRSASLVLAYLIRHQKMSLAEAYDHVKLIRPCIQPNAGFWRQLIAYEEHVRGERSMRIVSDTTTSLTIQPSHPKSSSKQSPHLCLSTPSSAYERPPHTSRYTGSQLNGSYDLGRRYWMTKGFTYGRY